MAIITSKTNTIEGLIRALPLNTELNNLYSNDVDLQSQIATLSAELLALDTDTYSIAEVNALDAYLQAQITTHITSLSAHLASSIVDDSTLGQVTVKGALDKLLTDLLAHINSLTAHDAQNLVLASEDPNLTATNIESGLEQLSTRISNIIASSGTSSTEVVDARLSSVYGAFATLATRLNASDVILNNISGTPTRSATQSGYMDIMSFPAGTRSGLLRGKLKGVTLYNAVVNGNFASGTAGWAAVNSSLSVTNKILSVAGDGTATTPQVFQNTSILATEGKKVFVMLKAKLTNSLCSIVRLQTLGSISGSSLTAAFQNTPIQNTNYELYGVVIIPSGFSGNVRVRASHQYADAATANGKVMEVDGNAGVFAIDMTALGLDSLTADEMAILCRNGYFEGFGNTKVDVKSVGKNLINKNASTLNYTLSSLGVLTASTTDDTTTYIRVKPSTNYYLSGKTVAKYYSLYDKNLSLLSTTQNTNGIIATTSTTAYIRVSYLQTNKDAVQLELGSVATTYEPYKISNLTLADSLKRVTGGTQDIYDTETGVSTKNISDQYTLLSGNISTLTVGTNIQYITIPLSYFNGIKTQSASAVDGSFAINKSWKETTGTIDAIGNDYKYITDATNLYVCFPLGTYANVSAAQTDLTVTNPTYMYYQLATPITTQVNKDLLSFENGTIWQDGVIPAYVEYTTPTNLASTIADQSLSNEHTQKRIQSIEAITTPLSNQVGQYGVRWNETLDVTERLGDAILVTDWDKVYPYSHIRRCNVKDNGEVSAYYGDPTYIEDGTNGQCMVEIPKFYSKYKYYTENGYEYVEWWVSAFPYEGYEVDRGFIYGEKELDKLYISSYEGSIYDTSALAYLLADEQVADFTVTTGDKLSSIANAKPASGLTQDLTLPKCRILANNRGASWGLWSGYHVAILQKLFIIEYASFNSQTKIGRGVVDKTDDGATNMANTTGRTSFLGNKSGREAGTDGLTSVSYRGVENMWGNIWSFVDGINVQADNKLWMNNVNKGMVSDSFVYPYVLQGTLANVNGYMSKLLKQNTMLTPIQTTGSSSTRIPDYYYQATGNRIALLGGLWNDFSRAGFACLFLVSASASRDRYFGGRLVMLK